MANISNSKLSYLILLYEIITFCKAYSSIFLLFYNAKIPTLLIILHTIKLLILSLLIINNLDTKKCNCIILFSVYLLDIAGIFMARSLLVASCYLDILVRVLFRKVADVQDVGGGTQVLGDLGNHLGVLVSVGP